jgi:hypothetical protein
MDHEQHGNGLSHSWRRAMLADLPCPFDRHSRRREIT